LKSPTRRGRGIDPLLGIHARQIDRPKEQPMNEQDQAQERLQAFHDQLKSLLAQYPEIHLAGDEGGDPYAYIRNSKWASDWPQIYLPLSHTP
jgi:hypothetical protein